MGRLAGLLKAGTLWPWWVASLIGGAKSFEDNPILGSRRLNRLGLHNARVRLAHWLADTRRARLARLVPAEDRIAFARDGFVLKPDFLPKAEFARLLDEIASYRGPAREMLQGDTITRRIAVDPPLLARLPALASLLGSRRFQGIVRYVGSFDTEPMVYIQTILTRVRHSAPDPQTSLHADTFHPTVKAWLFLTDVAADEAPLVYVPGSHRPTPARLAWERQISIAETGSVDRLTRRGSFRIDAATLASLGLPAPRVFAVAANTLVVADTYGFHARGTGAGPCFRAEIWGYGRQDPFRPWAGSLVGLVPALARRRATLFWWWRDRAEAIGLGRNPWRRRDGSCAFDGAETRSRAPVRSKAG